MQTVQGSSPPSIVGINDWPRGATTASERLSPDRFPTIGRRSVELFTLATASEPTAVSRQLGHLLKGDALLQLSLCLVDNDSSYNHRALNHHLPEFTDAHHHEAVGKNADHKRADDRPADRAPPPRHGGAAENRGGDGVQFERCRTTFNVKNVKPAISMTYCSTRYLINDTLLDNVARLPTSYPRIIS